MKQKKMRLLYVRKVGTYYTETQRGKASHFMYVKKEVVVITLFFSLTWALMNSDEELLYEFAMYEITIIE